MIIAQLSIAPVGVGTGLSKYVKVVIETLKKEGINYKTNAMSTVIETDDISTLFRVVEKAHTAMLSTGVQRVITELKIDDRKDKKATASSKIKAVQ
jgi:uncharacterized protein (TIGR00106 family)